MDYLVKVPFQIGGQAFKPGDVVSDGLIRIFVNDLLKSEVIVEKPAAPVASVEDEA